MTPKFSRFRNNPEYTIEGPYAYKFYYYTKNGYFNQLLLLLFFCPMVKLMVKLCLLDLSDFTRIFSMV